MRVPKGIRIKEVRTGTGEVASPGRIALLHYDCYLPRGDLCSSSRERPYPVQMRIGQRDALPAFEYGVLGMAEGGSRSVRVAPQLTYYERKLYPSLTDNVVLRYENELLRVSDQWDSSIYESLTQPAE
jgi:FKBP-type peptidyl-prolyl cis-trans isomerase